MKSYPDHYKNATDALVHEARPRLVAREIDRANHSAVVDALIDGALVNVAAEIDLGGDPDWRRSEIVVHRGRGGDICICVDRDRIDRLLAQRGYRRIVAESHHAEGSDLVWETWIAVILH